MSGPRDDDLVIMELDRDLVDQLGPAGATAVMGLLADLAGVIGRRHQLAQAVDSGRVAPEVLATVDRTIEHLAANMQSLRMMLKLELDVLDKPG